MGTGVANDAKYKVLVDTLKSAILCGRYDLDRPFPSERMLIRKYGHSRITVQHALRELERLGFISRQQGRGTFVTRQGASRKIGLIIPGLAYSDHFLSAIIGEISRLAMQEGYVLLLGNLSSPHVRDRVQTARRFARELVKEKVAGVIFQTFEFFGNAERNNSDIISEFDAAGIPVVLLECDILQAPERSKYDVVGVNDMDAGFRLGRSLIDSGMRQLSYLLLENSAPCGNARLMGLLAAVAVARKQGLRCSCETFCVDPENDRAVKRYLSRRKPDALVCGGSVMTMALLRTLERIGVDIPGDVRLGGFSEQPEDAISRLPVTMIRLPGEEIGKTTFYRLLERIARPDLPPLELLQTAPLFNRLADRKGKQVTDSKRKEKS